MNSKQKFETFLESLKKDENKEGNKKLIEAVIEGFHLCFEDPKPKAESEPAAATPEQ